MTVHHHYRLTKYDPALRDDSGAYTGDDWTQFTEIGSSFGGEELTLSTYLHVEARHLVVVARFLEESAISSVTALGVENRTRQFRVGEGARLLPVEAVEAVRQMLREEGWCRLVDGDRFYVHVGWDYYVYVGTERPCEQSVALAGRLGLFGDANFPSPYLEED